MSAHRRARRALSDPLLAHFRARFGGGRPGYVRRAMQNAQNLMSSFEFISILMSIIIGLGVTNLLAGAGRAFYRRQGNPIVGQPRRLPWQTQRLPYNSFPSPSFAITFSIPLTTRAKRS
jgi:hypothetical protein